MSSFLVPFFFPLRKRVHTHLQACPVVDPWAEMSVLFSFLFTHMRAHAYVHRLKILQSVFPSPYTHMQACSCICAGPPWRGPIKTNPSPRPEARSAGRFRCLVSVFVVVVVVVCMIGAAASSHAPQWPSVSQHQSALTILVSGPLPDIARTGGPLCRPCSCDRTCLQVSLDTCLIT